MADDPLPGPLFVGAAAAGGLAVALGTWITQSTLWGWAEVLFGAVAVVLVLASLTLLVLGATQTIRRKEAIHALASEEPVKQLVHISVRPVSVALFRPYENHALAWPMVRIAVHNPTPEAGAFWAKASWLFGGKPIHDPWEACWARTEDERVPIGGDGERELNLVVIDDRGFAMAVKPSFDPIRLHTFQRPLFDNVGELGIRVWREGAEGFAACGLRIVHRRDQDPFVSSDDSVLPESWRTKHQGTSS